MSRTGSRGLQDQKAYHWRILTEAFTEKSDNTLIQLFRYTIVGGFAFVIDFGSLVLLTSYFGVHYLLSAAIAFLFGLATNYTLSVSWVFSSRVLQSKMAEFGLFAWIGVVGLLLNEVFMWFFTGVAGLHYVLSKLISTGAVFFWNFLARKLLLFR